MTGIQPCLRKLGNNLGYYNGKEFWPRNIIERKIAVKLHNNHFCLILKSEGVNFNKGKEEMERRVKMADIYITEKMLILNLNTYTLLKYPINFDYFYRVWFRNI